MITLRTRLPGLPQVDPYERASMGRFDLLVSMSGSPHGRLSRTSGARVEIVGEAEMSSGCCE